MEKRTAKVYSCNQDGTVSVFLYREACHILNLDNKHGITLIPVYIPTLLSMDANYLTWGRLVPGWHLLPHSAEVAFQLKVNWEVDLLASSCTNGCQHYYLLENQLHLRGLGLNAFNNPWTCQVSYVFPPPAYFL